MASHVSSVELFQEKNFLKFELSKIFVYNEIECNEEAIKVERWM